MTELTAADIAAFDEAIAASTVATVSTRRVYRARLHSLQQLLFELRVLDAPPECCRRAGSIAERLKAVPAREIRRAMLRYLDTEPRSCAPPPISALCESLVVFGEFLGGACPEVTSLRQLDRGHIEAFLRHNATRPWRGRVARNQPVAASVAHATVLAVRNFLDDITLWGWAERPARQLIFAADVPRLERPLPRALAPDHDAALMSAVDQLDDPFARCGLIALRGAGLRLGELLDLELDSVVDYGPGRLLAAGPPRQARHRTLRAPRQRHPRRPRHLDGPPRPAARPAASPPRPAHRLPVHRTRPPARALAHPQGPQPRRHRGGIDRPRRRAAARRAPPAAPHLRHRSGQRRHDPASARARRGRPQGTAGAAGTAALANKSHPDPEQPSEDRWAPLLTAAA
nr:hypothetical protein [Egibacter rhizosphaerae]